MPETKAPTDVPSPEAAPKASRKPNPTKCGFIALLGRPNAGKSSLLNSLVGQKVAAVSRFRQTTRHSIRGIYTDKQYQFIFVDTPGLHQTHRTKPMNNLMRQIAEQVSQEVDVIAYLIDATIGWHDEDDYFLRNLVKQGLSKKIFILATKDDKIKRKDIDRKIDAIGVHLDKIFDTEKPILSCSAKRPDSIEELRDLFASYIPEGAWHFDEDSLSDQSENFLLAEVIQEQVFRQLHEELPYQCRVVVEAIDHQDAITHVHATIVVAQDSQKSIVIGAKGSQIKTLGQEARKNLETNLGKKVFLDLRVVVEKDWDRQRDVLTKYLNVT